MTRPFPNTTVVGAVDVHYDECSGATAALVVSNELILATMANEYIADIPHVAPYEPGALFKRELPCIEAVLALARQLELLIVDGYATLDPAGRPGLGAHAAEAFNLPVIGVAKTPFRAATHARKVIRGVATRPLYVTTAGNIEIDAAAKIVADMAGPHRIPFALARVDHLARHPTPSRQILTQESPEVSNR
jgi:deoxyribonuclease V